jgi:DNA-binding PadR family transcriptional regulator
MTTTLGHALLGLLAKQPLSGYQLSRRLKAPIGYFWAASHSQVYPELARLERDGLITSRVVPGPGPRDNKVHRITRKGRSALARWVTTPAPPEDNRDEFLLRIYSVWVADPPKAAAMVADHAAEHRRTLAEYTRIEKELVAAHDGPPPFHHPDFGSWATVRRGSSYERHVLRWCDWLLGELAVAQR